MNNKTKAALAAFVLIGIGAAKRMLIPAVIG